MRYGLRYMPGAKTVMIVCSYTVMQQHKNWVKTHESNGRYHYEVRRGLPLNTNQVFWSFENPEDATLFALLFA